MLYITYEYEFKKNKKWIGDSILDIKKNNNKKRVLS
jgi:hypothetical protein